MSHSSKQGGVNSDSLASDAKSASEDELNIEVSEDESRQTKVIAQVEERKARESSTSYYFTPEQVQVEVAGSDTTNSQLTMGNGSTVHPAATTHVQIEPHRPFARQASAEYRNAVASAEPGSTGSHVFIDGQI